MERIANDLGIQRSTLRGWQKRFGWTRPAAPEPPGPQFFRARRFGRPYGGDAVGMARDLVTGSALPLRRIAAQAGISRATLCRWKAARGWTRPEPIGVPPRRLRPRYPPEVVAAATELFRTTRLPAALIAARVGASAERVWHWARREGWTRPPRRPRRLSRRERRARREAP